MTFSTLLLCLAAFVQLSIAGYVLQDNYSPSNFFSMFDFFTDADPTNGFVQYVDQDTAQSTGLINNDGSSIYMGVDHTNVTPNGRPSVRISSKATYNQGLIILDASHMPGGICGTWPAFWTVGPNWPTSGEIDIIEGVNDQSTNSMTLHTGPNCGITNNNAFSGTIMTPNCDINAAGQATNQGCGIATTNTQTYGSGFNNIQGGVYATEWNSNAISIWFFPRSSIPSDITQGNPNPAGWGEPMSQFQGGCDIGTAFVNQQIVFDITFCGDWAGNVWNQGGCASQATTCNAFVENNPSAFQQAYWSINSLKVYQNNGGSAQPSSQPVSIPVPVSTQNIQTTFQVQPNPTTAPVGQGQPLPAGFGGSSPASTTVAAPVPAPSVAAASVAAAPTDWAPGDPLPASWFPDGGGSPPSRHRRSSNRRREHLRSHRKRYQPVGTA